MDNKNSGEQKPRDEIIIIGKVVCPPKRSSTFDEVKDKDKKEKKAKHTAIGVKIRQRSTKNDVIHTPLSVAKKLIDMCELKDGDMVLDPCCGMNRVFIDNFPSNVNKDWCEIEKEQDFFNYDKQVDCIIGNPPYSMWDKWLEHTMKLTNKFGYVFGVWNFTSARLMRLNDAGFKIVKLHMVDIEWWFGNTFLVVFEKTTKEPIMEISPRVYCDVCNSNCGRGKKGNHYNECCKNKE